MDNRGSGTIEIGIVLIVILLIIGLALTSYENTTDKIVNLQEKENMETLTSEFVDYLINNPGTPENWYESGKGTPGLAIINEGGQVIPNSVSYLKFIALGKNYKRLVDEKTFDSKIKTSIEIIPQKSSISSVKIGSCDDANNVFSVNRLVKCDFYKKYVIKDFENKGKCNRGHNQSSHSCNYFKIFKGNIELSDYYLLVDDDAKYIVDTTIFKGKHWQNPSDAVYLNDKIDFSNDTSAVVFIHFDKPHAKALLVSVPKNFDRNKLEYDYFSTNECQLIFKLWY